MRSGSLWQPACAQSDKELLGLARMGPDMYHSVEASNELRGLALRALLRRLVVVATCPLRAVAVAVLRAFKHPENFLGVRNLRAFKFQILERTNSEISSSCG